MSVLRSFGLKSIKLGDIPDDGSMSQMLVDAGLTYQDSASLKEADGQLTSIFAEEEDYPVEQLQDLGSQVLAWSTMDYTPAILALYKGGQVVNGQWQAPSSVVKIEKSIQLITKRDLLIEIPRADLRSIINLDLKKKSVSLLDNKATILLPNLVGLAPQFIGPYQSPTVSAGADANVAIGVHLAALAGVATAFRGDLTYQWTVKSKPAGAAPALATPQAINTQATNLTVAGPYVFTLTATDSNGYATSDDVTITITP